MVRAVVFVMAGSCMYFWATTDVRPTTVRHLQQVFDRLKIVLLDAARVWYDANGKCFATGSVGTSNTTPIIENRNHSHTRLYLTGSVEEAAPTAPTPISLVHNIGSRCELWTIGLLKISLSTLSLRKTRQMRQDRRCGRAPLRPVRCVRRRFGGGVAAE